MSPLTGFLICFNLWKKKDFKANLLNTEWLGKQQNHKNKMHGLQKQRQVRKSKRLLQTGKESSRELKVILILKQTLIIDCVSRNRVYEAGKNHTQH